MNDGLAGIALLKARSDIDSKHIGVWGLSQGGWLGPLAASRSNDVAFVVAVSGPGVTPGEQMIFFYANELRRKGFSAEEIEDASTVRGKVWNYLANGTGYEQAKSAIQSAQAKRWYESLRDQRDHVIESFNRADVVRNDDWYTTEMNYDPVATLRKLKVPALFLFGDDDQLVPVPRSAKIIQQTLTASGNRDFTIKIFPGADHQLLLHTGPGAFQLAPGYQETMKQWLVKRAGL